MQKFVILDRDGVINVDSDNFVRSVEQWQPIPGSLQAITRLKKAGYTVAVATNQSGIFRGHYDLAELHKMHAKMQRLLAELGGSVDKVYFCPHGPDEGCSCRKPLPGMYIQAAADFGVELNNVPVIGDSLRDLHAAIAVNAKPILVKTGKGERTLANPELPDAIPVYADLAAAVDALLETTE